MTSIDLLGPGTLAQGVTARPGDTRIAGLLDTWFRDCTDDVTDDGTAYEAAFFNGVLALIRAVARTNGLTGLGANVVTESNADDDLLLKAIQHMVQRGQTNYQAIDSGAADAMVISLSPAMAEYKEGHQIVWFKCAHTNLTTTPTININGLGPKTIVRADGTAVEAGEIVINGVYGLQYDGTNMRLRNPVRPATLAEVNAGVMFSPFVSPATLLQRKSPYFVATTPGGGMNVNNGVNTVINNMTLQNSYFADAASVFSAGGSINIGPKDAGVWLMVGYAAMDLGTDTSAGHDYRIGVRRNAVTSLEKTVYIKEATTVGNEVVVPLVALSGDDFDVNVYHNSGTNRNFGGTFFAGLRIGASA